MLLQRAAGREPPPAAIRVLLLSRQPMDCWRDDIEQAGASSRCDSYEVTIGPLEMQASVRLFCAVAKRLAADRKIDLPALSDGAIEAWIGRDPPLHRLPLYTTAAAIHAVIEPAETLDLTAAEIVTALVERERRRLDAAGRNAGWAEPAASRLAGLAALRAGLDAEALRRVASSELEIGLPPPEKIVDAVMSFGWWQNDRLPAPQPDIMAAALLTKILSERPDKAAAWLWAVIEDVPAAALIDRLGRLAFDTMTVTGSALGFTQYLRKIIAGDPSRAARLEPFSYENNLPFGLAGFAADIATALSATADDEGERARHLSNLSGRLSEAGDGAEALDILRADNRRGEVLRSLPDRPTLLCYM